MRGRLVEWLAGSRTGRRVLCLGYWPAIVAGAWAERCPCGGCE